MQNNTFPTLFIGQNLIKLSRVDSTNNYLKGLLSNSEPLPEGTVIMAEEQFAGRGQQNNNWIAEAGKNLTCSIFLKPAFLPINKQFFLNIFISIGIINAFKKNYDIELKIKWPNDLYFENKKVGGVLIETIIGGSLLKQAVAGIGLNINQTSFEEALQKKATSLIQITNVRIPVEDMLSQISVEIEASYLQLKAGNYAWLKSIYLAHLYKKDIIAFYRQNGETFEGIITGITETGELLLTRAGIETAYNFKEIEFVVG